MEHVALGSGRVLVSPGDENRAILDVFMRSPQEYVRQGRVFKPGSRGFAVMAEIGGRVCFIKHYRSRGWIYRVRNAFRPSRAARTFEVTRRLLTLGVPVPAPLFCLEQRRYRLLGEAYLVSEFIDQSINLRQFWDRSDDEARSSVLRRVAEIIGKMHAAGCCHGDLKWNNLLVGTSGSAFRIVLVDLDAASCRPGIGRRRCETDLRRFLRDLAAVDPTGGYRRQFLAEWQRWTSRA